jgi:outer membrane lipoprotein-sorting protein
MKLFIICSISGLLTLNIYGQNDPEALRILDRFAEVSQAAPSVKMKFHLTTTDLLEGSHDTIDGSVIMKGDNFFLDLKDNIIWFNGETVWNLLPAEKEVTISSPDENEISFINKPSTIFSLYKQGYKNRLVEEKSGSWLIDLYPEDLKSDLVRIRILIGKPSLNLISVEYKKKDGFVAIMQVREYDLKQKADPALFSFSPGKYKDVEIIDLR